MLLAFSLIIAYVDIRGLNEEEMAAIKSYFREHNIGKIDTNKDLPDDRFNLEMTVDNMAVMTMVKDLSWIFREHTLKIGREKASFIN